MTALGQVKYKEMAWSEIAMTLISGIAFGVFFIKPVAQYFTTNSDIVAAAVYLGASGWNILLPAAILRLKKAFAEKELL